MTAPLTLSWLLLLLLCVEGNSFYCETLCWCSVHYGPVSIRLSVTRRSSTVTGKRLNVGLNKQCLDSAGTLSFLMHEVSAKFDRGRPLQGHQI